MEVPFGCSARRTDSRAGGPHRGLCQPSLSGAIRLFDGGGEALPRTDFSRRAALRRLGTRLSPFRGGTQGFRGLSPQDSWPHGGSVRGDGTYARSRRGRQGAPLHGARIGIARPRHAHRRRGGGAVPPSRRRARENRCPRLRRRARARTVCCTKTGGVPQGPLCRFPAST